MTKPLQLHVVDDPDAASRLELERLRARGLVRLADVIERAWNAQMGG